MKKLNTYPYLSYKDEVYPTNCEIIKATVDLSHNNLTCLTIKNCVWIDEKTCFGYAHPASCSVQYDLIVDNDHRIVLSTSANPVPIGSNWEISGVTRRPCTGAPTNGAQSLSATRQLSALIPGRTWGSGLLVTGSV